VLGQKPSPHGFVVGNFDKRIHSYEPVVVLNDEAHHTPDEESEWDKWFSWAPFFLQPNPGGFFCATASLHTPRHSKVSYFHGRFSDILSSQSIIDNV